MERFEIRLGIRQSNWHEGTKEVTVIFVSTVRSEQLRI